MKVAIGNKTREIPKYMYGWYNGLISQGFEVILWNEEQESAFDFFAKHSPEVLLTNLQSLSRPVQKCVNNRNIRVLTREKELAGPGYDSLVFHDAAPKPELASDLVFIGNPTPERVKLLKEVCKSSYNVKLFGNQSWPFTQYCGSLDISENKHAYASARLSIDFGGDTSRPYEIVACDGILLTSDSSRSEYFDNARYYSCSSDILKHLEEWEPTPTMAKGDYSYGNILRNLLENIPV